MPSQKQSEEEKYRRAQHAEQLLQDEVLQEMFADLKAEYLKGWEASKSEMDREYFWYLVTALEDVKKNLKIHADRKMVRDKQAEKE